MKQLSTHLHSNLNLIAITTSEQINGILVYLIFYYLSLTHLEIDTALTDTFDFLPHC